ncbi:MAG: UMP kinase [Legionella sp.]|nr:UMP kinase [Legionella sp.]
MIPDNVAHLKYKRILLKYSGEALMGQMQFGIDSTVLARIAQDIVELSELGVTIGLVIGGGNLFRGKSLAAVGVDRVTGDQMGMLATVMNALALRDALLRFNLPVRIMSAVGIPGFVETYAQQDVMAALANKEIVIFAGGTGNPFFTTDSAVSLRAIETQADIVLKATKVDGIYSADPFKDKKAVRYHSLSYQQVLEEGLEVMDATAICLCREHRIPILVFDMTLPNALKKIVMGEPVGTFVGENNAQ